MLGRTQAPRPYRVTEREKKVWAPQNSYSWLAQIILEHHELTTSSSTTLARHLASHNDTQINKKSRYVIMSSWRTYRSKVLAAHLYHTFSINGTRGCIFAINYRIFDRDEEAAAWGKQRTSEWSVDSAGIGPRLPRQKHRERLIWAPDPVPWPSRGSLCPSSGGSDASSRSPRMANWRALVHASTPRLLRPRGRLPGIHRIDSDPKFFFFVRKGITSRGLDGRWVQKRLLPTVERAFWTDPVFINRPRLALSLSDAAANNQSCSAAAGGVTYATFFIF
jgi:hypothetical protein